MEGKTVRETSVVMVQRMTPQDVNVSGNVHGGVIMKLIDEAAGVVATRHARGNTVTASVDKIDFLKPVFSGDLVTLRASLNLVGRTSMEVGVHVESENIMTSEVRHTTSAYLIYVALDNDGKTTAVPPLILETEEEIRRNRDAQLRRDARLHEKMSK
ncbi:acyl-CoA thioesterase [Chloroflexota bacterium]